MAFVLFLWRDGQKDRIAEDPPPGRVTRGVSAAGDLARRHPSGNRTRQSLREALRPTLFSAAGILSWAAGPAMVPVSSKTVLDRASRAAFRVISRPSYCFR